MEDNDMKKAAKPDLERYYGIVLKGYCGACNRLMFTRGKYTTLADVMERIECQWCGKRIDWSDLKELK